MRGGPRCDGSTGVTAVLTALDNADVVQALANESALYGQRGIDSIPLQIAVGDRGLAIGYNTGCQGSPLNCIPTPPGVQALIDLLSAIDDEESTTGMCQGFKP